MDKKDFAEARNLYLFLQENLNKLKEEIKKKEELFHEIEDFFIEFLSIYYEQEETKKETVSKLKTNRDYAKQIIQTFLSQTELFEEKEKPLKKKEKIEVKEFFKKWNSKR